ncbi:hypothetical protein DM02DRAFT_615719 [Periconia macrospinosa]|uniref:Zn(2)-C6 fungal-type domain-containing protein n=1 Tax=Periconia macrospinosa TaxID=97972 RepID=A0A2V1DK74_9PLEO|nr:hypothetical protein DM02DRAFT_615719 [Periconia macrospinosa]
MYLITRGEIKVPSPVQTSCAPTHAGCLIQNAYEYGPFAIPCHLCSCHPYPCIRDQQRSAERALPLALTVIQSWGRTPDAQESRTSIRISTTSPPFSFVCESTMNQEKPKKRRTACDSCHRGKTKCSGGTPCTFCVDGGRQCTYSEPSRLGRPKGSKNKRTLEKCQAQCQAQEAGETKQNRAGASQDWLDIQNTIDLEQYQKQHQLSQSLPIFETSRDGSTGGTITPIRTQSDVSVLGDLPMNFFDLLNGDESTGDRRVSLSNNDGVRLPSSHLSPMDPAPSNDTSFQNLYGSFERTVPNINPFNNYPATTEMDMSSTGNGHLFGNTQFPTSLTPQYLQNFLDDVSMSSPEAVDSSGSSTSTNACECLDRQVRLLFRMDKVEQSQKKSSPDVALIAARDAMEQWDNLRQCTVCRKSGTEGVFLMFVMSMRFLLRALRCSFAKAAAVGGIDRTTTQQQSPSASTEDSTTGGYQSNWNVSVGKYEATGEEYKITTRMLIVLAVQRIETALAYAKTRLQHRQAAARLETKENKGRADAIAMFDRLIRGDQRALLTENGFDSRMGILLHGLEGIIGSN